MKLILRGIVDRGTCACPLLVGQDGVNLFGLKNHRVGCPELKKRGWT